MKISWHQLEIWWSQIEPVNGYLRQLNRQLMPWNFQIQYSYLHPNALYLKISRHQLEIWWSQIEFTSDAIADPVNVYLRPSNRKLRPWNFQIQYSYLHSNAMLNIKMYSSLNGCFRVETTELRRVHVHSFWHPIRTPLTRKKSFTGKYIS